MYVHLMDRVLNDYIIVIIHTLVYCQVSFKDGLQNCMTKAKKLYSKSEAGMNLQIV